MSVIRDNLRISHQTHRQEWKWGEESEAILLLASPAPYAQVMGNFRDETAFCNTEGEVDGDEPGKAGAAPMRVQRYLMWGG